MASNPLLLLLVGFVLTTVLGGLLTYLFQQRSWSHQYRIGRDDHARELAMSTFEELSTLLDQRLYRMRVVYWAAKQRARAGPDADTVRLTAALTDYRLVVQHWNDNLNRNLALVETYFGGWARQRLDSRLYEDYASIGEELDEFVREVSRRGDEPVPIRPIGTRLDQLGRDVYAFNVEVLRRLRDGALGVAAPAESLSDEPARDTLRFGDKGTDVRKLQETLRDTGARDLRPDAHFGRDTERAVRDFQRRRQLRQDGVAGPSTRAALAAEAPRS